MLLSRQLLGNLALVALAASLAACSAGHQTSVTPSSVGQSHVTQITDEAHSNDQDKNQNCGKDQDPKQQQNCIHPGPLTVVCQPTTSEPCPPPSNTDFWLGSDYQTNKVTLLILDPNNNVSTYTASTSSPNCGVGPNGTSSFTFTAPAPQSSAQVNAGGTADPLIVGVYNCVINVSDTFGNSSSITLTVFNPANP